MYKLLYTLVSSEKDLYCEQCMLSIMTVKRNSPKSKISLLVDEITLLCIKKIPNRKKILDLIDEVISVPRPNDFSSMETSRFLKTSMRKHVKGDFLYIDSDTIICSPLDEIENCPFDLAGVLDQHMNLSQNTHASVFKQHILKVSGLTELTQCEKYINGGVMWVRDTEKNKLFFEDWNRNWLSSRQKGIKTDMPALMLTNFQHKDAIHELSGIWNCQVWFAANYLSNAKIIHYFSSIGDFTGGYGKFNTDLPLKIKMGQPLSDADWQIIDNARNAFPSPNAIIVGSDYEIYRSSLCGLLRALYRKRALFNFFERLLYGIRIFRAKKMLKRK